MEQTLVSYKVGASNVGRAGFIEKITKDAMDFLASHRGERYRAIREELAYNQAMAALIERLYDSLRLYCFQFNRSLGWPELHVTCTKPEFVTEVMRYNKLREPTESYTYYRARLSTRHVTLMMRGRRDTIEFFLIPPDKVIALSLTEANYEPVSSLRAKLVDDLVTWELDADVLTEGGYEVLCMQLFEKLIDESREELKNHWKD